MPKVLQGRGKLWGIQAEDAEILAKVEGLLHLEVRGRESHGAKGDRGPLKVAGQASSVRLFLMS